MKIVRSGWWLVMIAAMLPLAGMAQESKKLSRAEALAAVVSKISPEYPALAKQLKVHGVAELEAVIAEDGSVERVNIVSGNPILTKPAAEALKKWKFRPASSDGKTVKAVAPVAFTFDL